MKTKPKVLIVVEGGIVQSVISDGPVEILIKDFDNIEQGDQFDPQFSEPDLIVTDADRFMSEVMADVDPTL